MYPSTTIGRKDSGGQRSDPGTGLRHNSPQPPVEQPWPWETDETSVSAFLNLLNIDIELRPDRTLP